MVHAERCPICGGTGVVVWDNEKGRYVGCARVEISAVPCHGCGGKGWVEVNDEGLWWTSGNSTTYSDGDVVVYEFTVPEC